MTFAPKTEEIDLSQKYVEHYLLTSLKNGINGFISDKRKLYPDNQVISKDNLEQISQINLDFASKLSNLLFSENNPF
jgi:hypothetical protein